MTALVYVHGMWSTPAVWTRFRGLVGAPGHVVALPRTKNGQGVEALGVRDYVDAVVDELRQRERPVVVGHSMGGLLAMLAAQRVELGGLVLLAPAPPWGVWNLSTTGIRTLAPVLREPFWRRPMVLTEASARYGVFNAADPERVPEFVQALVPESGRALFEIALWMFDRSRASAMAPGRPSCPLLVVAGGRDRLIPPTVVARTARRLGTTARIYADCGHWMLDEPSTAEIATDVRAWLDRHGVGGSSSSG